MKHVIFYGPGSSPTLLVEDDQAAEITEKFKKGEPFEVSFAGSVVYVRENACWAMKVEEFKDRREGNNGQQHR